MKAGGSTRHPVRGYLHEHDAYRPAPTTTLSDQMVTSVTLSGRGWVGAVPADASVRTVAPRTAGVVSRSR
jgi:hypothetical protein